MLLDYLPKWQLLKDKVAFYDTESATAIEQTAKLYGAVNEVIEALNEFATTFEKQLDELSNSTVEEINLFEMSIRQEFQDFIDIVDLKLASLDSTVNNTVRDLVSEGKIGLVEVYDDETNSLIFKIGGNQ